jgi:hypothetical protein
MRGSATPERNSTSVAELGFAAFAAAYNRGDVNYQRDWTREAFKRTISPILTVTYLLVGVRLALLGLGGRRETSWRLYAISGGVIALRNPPRRRYERFRCAPRRHESKESMIADATPYHTSR